MSLGGDLAYNTVQTILSRLAEKHLVVRTKTGHAHAYAPALAEAEAAAAQVRVTLSRATDPALPLQRFAASLDETEAHILRELLAKDQDPS